MNFGSLFGSGNCIRDTVAIPAVLTAVLVIPGVTCGLSEGQVTDLSGGADCYRVEGARFYSIRTVDVDGDGRKEIIAGGQIFREGGNQGYLLLLSRKDDGTIRPMGEDHFPLTQHETSLPVRIRSVDALFHKEMKTWIIFAAGKAGEDESGVGFLRTWTWSEGKLSAENTLVLDEVEVDYTHGYPLVVSDLEGDGRMEIIYGGFTHGDTGDRADVRIFGIGPDGRLAERALRPFVDLPIPFRVNALVAGDINSDEIVDIIIGGRSEGRDDEQSALAWWMGKEVGYRVLKEEGLRSRYRTLLPLDMDGDGKEELIAGGRLKMGSYEFAALDCWTLEGTSLRLLSRYRWTHDGATRLRDLLPLPDFSLLLAAGRTEIFEGDERIWKGFLQPFQCTGSSLIPTPGTRLIKLNRETRFRDVAILENGSIAVAGFSMDREKKSTGEVLILHREKP